MSSRTPTWLTILCCLLWTGCPVSSPDDDPPANEGDDDDDDDTGDDDTVEPATLPGEPWTGAAEEFVVDSDGVELFVRSQGAGDHVVLVTNGGPGQSHTYCESMDVLATTEVRVVTFDQRGTGQTPHPEPGEYSYAHYVEDMEAVRSHLGVDQIHLLGHSFGGMLSIAYTATYPEHVASLQLYSSSPVRLSDSDLAEFSARIEEFEAQGLFPEGYNNFEGTTDCAPYFQTIWPVYLHDVSFEMPDLLRQTTCDIETYLETGSANDVGYNYSDGVAAYEGSVSVSWGEADPFIEESLSIAAYFEQATVTETEIPECGHYWEECLETFVANTTAFLVELL